MICYNFEMLGIYSQVDLRLVSTKGMGLVGRWTSYRPRAEEARAGPNDWRNGYRPAAQK